RLHEPASGAESRGPASEGRAMRPPPLGRRRGQHAVPCLLRRPVSAGRGDGGGLFAGAAQGSLRKVGPPFHRYSRRRCPLSAGSFCSGVGITRPGLGHYPQGKPSRPAGGSGTAHRGSAAVPRNDFPTRPTTLAPAGGGLASGRPGRARRQDGSGAKRQVRQGRGASSRGAPDRRAESGKNGGYKFPGYEAQVRAGKNQTTRSRGQHQLLCVYYNVDLGAIPPYFIHQLGRSRWTIDVQAFQTITTDCHLKQPSAHQDCALIVLTMIRVLAYTLTMVFYYRQVRSHCRGVPPGFCDMARQLAYCFLTGGSDTSLSPMATPRPTSSPSSSD